MIAIALGLLSCFPPVVIAQVDELRTKEKPAATDHGNEKKIPLFRVGALGGRGGVALGLQGYGEFNLFQNLGIYGMAGRSRVSGYQTTDPQVGPLVAQEKDFTACLGFLGRSPAVKRTFHFGGFAQACYLKSGVKANYTVNIPDPEAVGGFDHLSGGYEENERNPLVTLGGQVELSPRHGPSYLFRIGKNFGDNYAANNGKGFYLVGGPVFDPIHTIKAIKGWF